ncbi:DUF2012 domain-containing protein [Rhodohalobacter sp. SW132]|uniref:beta-sandwich domain-containing protein n=1 Tax=Rhodohalobacter sp. SW132 TaxID=2293433 RepID=UPI000E253AD5|nr:DUF2012 domain-containing protein [Rhodohalobacter sp. SW132]REL38543.1 DUF2012 domain-containing protein [Rhodohalobacter sp. SW132]
MKSRIVFYLTMLAASGLIFGSCAKESVEAESFGDIDGIVINSETETGLGTVNITTTPASNAIFTESDGTFTIQNVPTGNYTIQARKKDYSNASVSVSVRDGQTAVAKILMNPVDEDEDSTATTDDFRAEITAWFNDVDGDSTHVDVNYRVTNTSEAADIEEYEVYFEILTVSGTSYFFDVSGETLRAGQSRNGEHRHYIRNEEATDVIINDVWILQ